MANTLEGGGMDSQELPDRLTVQFLLDALQLIGSAGMDTEKLFLGFLRKIIETTQAERGVLMLTSPENKLTIRMGLDRDGTPLDSISRFSLSIPEKSVATRSAMCVVQAFDGEMETHLTSSMQAYNLRSVMCVPLETGGGILGVVYVDSGAALKVFRKRNLTDFKVICSHLALHIENARFREDRNQQETAHRESLEAELIRLQRSLTRQNILVGQSPVMIRLFRQIQKVAPTKATVLLLGETGTGKESAARLIHDLSQRQTKPFIVVDCGTIPENLLESELFGHEKGAFTGAYERKIGKFELATGGTVFLDEIGDLPGPLQGKLLRILEQEAIERIGNTRPVKVDTRIITATNRDLESMTRTGSFRSDLFYRLNVVHLTLPPLRNRGADVPELAGFFLKQCTREYGKHMDGFTDEAMEKITTFHWPGNVRELKHRIQRAVILAETPLISPTEMDFESSSDQHSTKTDTDSPLDKPLRDMLKTFLETHPGKGLGKFLTSLHHRSLTLARVIAKGNQSRAAWLLGLERRQLSRRLAQPVSEDQGFGDPDPCQSFLDLLESRLSDRNRFTRDACHFPNLLKRIDTIAAHTVFEQTDNDLRLCSGLLGWSIPTLKRRLKLDNKAKL